MADAPSNCVIAPGPVDGIVERMADGEVLYESIGSTYSATRREDPRVRAQVQEALGDAASIVNVGAGTGNYEPIDRRVVAVEPSLAMLGQRAGRTSTVVRGVAEALPFRDGSFDASLAILTIHHWSDVEAGLRELARVSRRQVVFFFEPLHTHSFWALDYFPEALDLPTEREAPGEAVLARVLHLREIRTVLVPADCVDGFGTAYWARPEAYTDPVVQAGMSWLALLSEEARQRGSRQLADDLASGAWDRRHGHLRRQDSYDGGYRIAIAGS
jgi:SAM-dependent methyltransferase